MERGIDNRFKILIFRKRIRKGVGMVGSGRVGLCIYACMYVCIDFV